MTANELRQSFFDFFKEKQHTIVPSASLLPTSPNLQFTNAGMNQFVPYFLGVEKAPYNPPRAADTQKCIRAGGKHNDLKDVGYDTYHHTFFEMLGNWSFGDYFKTEAIQWAWELIVERWGFPAERLYATVYSPSEGDPSEFDQQAYDIWAELFTKAGLDPKTHIVNGNVKDNFWAMGETGPCGPCSELHVDLTENGDTEGKLVNMDDPRCIEIWNLVFIQFNRDEDGSYRPLPAQHVDTGMGFERACSIMQCTKGFTDFSDLASNYNTDVFFPIFEKIKEISGKTYTSTIKESRKGLTEQEQIDVAFRVIADHIRAVSFSIADGILPDNKDRGSTVRTILRRAVRFGRELGLEGDDPFMVKLVPTLVEHFGHVFPELAERQSIIESTLIKEEEQFNRTLDRGLKLFSSEAEKTKGKDFEPATVVKLWETYGFPIELSLVLLEERGFDTDWDEVDKLIQKQLETGKGGEKTTTISAVDISTDAESEFVGYDADETEAEILEVIEEEGQTIVIVDRSPLYVEKGGQVGDQGTLLAGDEVIPIVATSSVGAALCLHLAMKPSETEGKVTIRVEQDRRRDIEKHHTATHIMHWALHEAVDPNGSQQGSLVAQDRLRFDFNSEALTSEQILEVERLVNERIVSDDPVSWSEVPHADIKERDDIMQFFGDKYGDMVRVVQIGGQAQELDGYSMELCGGTHVRQTSEIGLFTIKSEGAVSAGTRRIEALCGEHAREHLKLTYQELTQEIADWKAQAQELAQQLEESPNLQIDLEEPDFTGLNAGSMSDTLALLADWREAKDKLKDKVLELKKQLQKKQSRERAAAADQILGDLVDAAVKADSEFPIIVEKFEDSDAAFLQEGLNGLKKRQFSGAAVMLGLEEDKANIAIYVASGATGKVKAGDLMKELAPILGGRGGGKPEMARGAGPDLSKVDEFLAAAQEKLEAAR